MNRVSGTCWTKTEDLIFMSLEYWKEMRNKSWKSTQVNKGWKLSNLARDINLHTQEADFTLNRKGPVKSMPSCNIIKLLKTKDKRTKSWKLPEEKMEFLSTDKRTIRRTADFSSETMDTRKKSQNSFLVLKRKDLSTQNPTASENILQEWRGNQNILRWKTKRICHHHTYLKRMTKKCSLSFFLKGNLKNRKERKAWSAKIQINTFDFSSSLWVF